MRMRTTAFFLLLLSSLALAKPVGRVQNLYGEKKLYVQADASAPWYRSFLEQDAEIGNHFKTDTDSMASLKFFLGGKVGLGKDCEVEIITDRSTALVREGINLKKGKFWAKFDKQKEEPIRIQTAGGVMGIRGTEFLLEVKDDGTTELSLVEGSVEIVPKVGEPLLAEPGMKVNFGPETGLLYKVYQREQLLEEIEKEVGPAFFEMRKSLLQTREALRDANLQVRTAEAEWKIDMLEARAGALEGENPPNAPSTRQGMQTAGEALKNLDRILAGMEPEDGDPGTTASAPPDGIPVLGSRPSVQWKSMPASRYAVMFLDRYDDRQVYWMAETEQTSYAYPEDAKPFQPGVYRLRVVPLNESGEVQGDAVDFDFRVLG